jgi:hypothetical protein
LPYRTLGMRLIPCVNFLCPIASVRCENPNPAGLQGGDIRMCTTDWFSTGHALPLPVEGFCVRKAVAERLQHGRAMAVLISRATFSPWSF